jgi:O-antigen ligase
VALGIFVVWFLLPQPYKERVLDPSQYTQSESVRNRMQLQQSAWEQFTAHPVWGVGLGGYGPRMLDDNTRVARIMRWFVEEHDWPPRSIGPHNMYLQVLAETGVVGLLLFCTFFAVLIRELRVANRTYRELGDDDGMALTATLEVGLVAFLICGIFLHALTQKVWWMVAATAAAASLHAALLRSPRSHGGTRENGAARAR